MKLSRIIKILPVKDLSIFYICFKYSVARITFFLYIDDLNNNLTTLFYDLFYYYCTEIRFHFRYFVSFAKFCLTYFLILHERKSAGC